MSYITTIIEGFLAFPFVAALITFPYALYQYNKYGAVSRYRTLIIYSFILYLLVAYFLVTLPLPDPATTVGNRWQDHLSLIPFRGIARFWAKHQLSLQSLSDFLTSSALWQVLFNFLLTVPFGMYMRYYFKQSLGRTVLFTFLLSLSFELSQLTALWGIYPGPYRMADVEDLITNTTGGALGWQIVYVFMMVLPDRDSIDARCRESGRVVTGRRRFWASLFDFSGCLILFLFIQGALEEFIPGIVYSDWGFWTLFCVFSVVQIFATGRATLGHIICRMVLVSDHGGVAKRKQLFKRYLYIWLFTELPLIVASLLTSVGSAFLGEPAIIAIDLVSWAYPVAYLVIEVFGNGSRPMPHDRLSETSYVAIEVPKQHG